MFMLTGYIGCQKYVPIDQRLNFRAHRGYNLKRNVILTNTIIKYSHLNGIVLSDVQK